jgi:hypothetical protein
MWKCASTNGGDSNQPCASAARRLRHHELWRNLDEAAITHQQVDAAAAVGQRGVLNQQHRHA